MPKRLKQHTTDQLYDPEEDTNRFGGVPKGLLNSLFIIPNLRTVVSEDKNAVIQTLDETVVQMWLC